MENKELNIQQKLMNIQHSDIWVKKEAKGYGYQYFKKEQIITELKPLLKEQGLGYRYNIEHKEIIDNKLILEVQVHIIDNNNGSLLFKDIMVVDLNKKGMDAGQSKGASDTYFWKYALANIFMIPTSDKDLDDIHEKQQKKEQQKKINLPKRLAKATESNDLETLKSKLKDIANKDKQGALEIKSLLQQYNNKFSDIPRDELEMLVNSYE